MFFYLVLHGEKIYRHNIIGLLQLLHPGAECKLFLLLRYFKIGFYKGAKQKLSKTVC